MPSMEEMKKKVSSYLLAQGVFEEADVAKHVALLAGDCPASLAAEKGATDDYAKAYLTIITAEGADVVGGAPAVTQTTGAAAMPTSTVTAEEARKIAESLTKTKNERNMLSAGTVITELVLDKPAPSELIKPGTKGIINQQSWKNIMEKYADKVLADDADENIKSTTNFNALKAAAEAGTPVEVMIGAQSKKVVAVKVQIPEATGSSKKAQTMNIEQFENFIVLETAGWVLATEATAGAKLRYVKPAKDKKNPNIFKPARVLLAFTNRSKAATTVSRNVLSETNPEAACKSAWCFKVDTGNKSSKDGVTPIYKTIRVTVNAPVALTERKVEYKDILPPVGKNKEAADLMTAPDQKALKSINEAQVTKIAELQAKVANGDFQTIMQYGDALKAFNGAAAPATASVGM